MSSTETTGRTDGGPTDRQRLLADLPVTGRRMSLAGVSTYVLEGGAGSPLILLHGPGEFAESWLRVVPDLVTTHRMIAPDLPGHGASEIDDGVLDAGRMLAWLAELVDRTCGGPATLVGRTLGGAIAARFALEHREQVGRLVLVDTFGPAPCRPAPEFGQALHEFLAAPSEHTYTLLMRRCSFDLDRLRDRLGARWEALSAYAVDRARTASVQAALHAALTGFGGPIPPDDLGRIGVPTSLIWGRHDLRHRWASPNRPAPASAGRCTSSRTPPTTRASISPRPSSRRCAPRCGPPPDRRRRGSVDFHLLPQLHSRPGLAGPRRAARAGDRCPSRRDRGGPPATG